MIIQTEQNLASFFFWRDAKDRGKLPCHINEYMTGAYWSEYEQRHIPASEAVFSNYYESYVREDDTVYTMEGHLVHREDDKLRYSYHSGCHFIYEDDFTYCKFLHDFVPTDEVEDIALKHISQNVPTEDIIEFANN